MHQITSVAALREWVKAERGQGRRIALVPTMGALHAGHMTLVEAARGHAESVVVSIFVNPTQFGPNEDYGSYPRKLAEDAALCERHGVAAVYAPTVAEMYPDGFATSVAVKGLTEGLCGAVRPGHFDGVATVVAKLLLQALPDVACFGEKDYQQLQVLKRLVKDLDIPVAVEGVATAREADGLALSSRNAYLKAEERAIAPKLYEVLVWAKGQLSDDAEALDPVMRRGDKSGGGVVRDILREAEERLVAAGFASVDYFSLVHGESLQPLTAYVPPARLIVAARLGKARLIDNIG